MTGSEKWQTQSLIPVLRWPVQQKTVTEARLGYGSVPHTIFCDITFSYVSKLLFGVSLFVSTVHEQTTSRVTGGILLGND